MVKVGTKRPKTVSKANNKLFLKGRKILETNLETSSIGWGGFGKFIDYLEKNYDITKKNKK